MKKVFCVIMILLVFGMTSSIADAVSNEEISRTQQAFIYHVSDPNQLLSDMRKATQNSVSDYFLMKQVIKLRISEVYVGDAEIIGLAAASTITSKVTGKNIPEVMDSITNSVAYRMPMELVYLGILKSDSAYSLSKIFHMGDSSKKEGDCIMRSLIYTESSIKLLIYLGEDKKSVLGSYLNKAYEECKKLEKRKTTKKNK